MGNIKLYNGDCLEKLKDIQDKSINLVLIDPPYNIGKDKWDKWKTVDDYVEFMGKVFKEIERILKDNGSFYFFHNDFLQIVELQNFINKNTNFIFKSLITWDKLDNADRFQMKGIIKGYGALRNYYNGMNEYCLYYVMKNGEKTEWNKTGLQTINNDLELYKPIRDYFQKERKKTSLSYKQLNELMGVSSNGGGMASNILTSYKKGWTFPTKEKYELLQTTGICQKPYTELRQEYEKLRQEYEEIRQKKEEERKQLESLRYVFNKKQIEMKGKDEENLKKDLKKVSPTWNFKRPKEIYCNGHITPKPVEMLEHIISTSSNENDIVLDCFMGSGSTGVACKHLNRRFIGIEINEKYFEIAKNRIELE